MRPWPGRPFDGRTARGQAVSVRLTDRTIEIEPDDGSATVVWPLRGIEAEWTPDSHIRLQRRGDAARLTVEDPDATATVALALGLRSAGRAAWWPIIAGSIATLVFGAIMLWRLPDVMAPLIPAGWQAPLGRTMEAGIVSGPHTCPGASGQSALERVAAALARTGGIDRPVHVVVANDPMVNAFTLPGDRIVIMRGLIADATDSDELAGVLAHELGHVAHRDSMRLRLHQVGLRILAAAMGWDATTGVGLGQAALSLSYDRVAETAADDFAVTTLTAAGLRADGLGRFLARMEAKDTQVPAFLSDHPSSAERRQRIARPSGGMSAFTPAEWESIQGMCAGG